MTNEKPSETSSGGGNMGDWARAIRTSHVDGGMGELHMGQGNTVGSVLALLAFSVNSSLEQPQPVPGITTEDFLLLI